MLPWCSDERDEVVHSEYIRLLASLDLKSRIKASKHAINAASTLLRASRALKQRSHSNAKVAKKVDFE